MSCLFKIVDALFYKSVPSDVVSSTKDIDSQFAKNHCEIQHTHFDVPFSPLFDLWLKSQLTGSFKNSFQLLHITVCSTTPCELSLILEILPMMLDEPAIPSCLFQFLGFYLLEWNRVNILMALRDFAHRNADQFNNTPNNVNICL